MNRITVGSAYIEIDNFDCEGDLHLKITGTDYDGETEQTTSLWLKKKEYKELLQALTNVQPYNPTK